MTKYFDYCASSPIHPKVQDIFIKMTKEIYANPSSTHKMGKEAKSFVEKAREKISEILNVKSGEIFFTSGATESNNLALLGVINAAKRNQKKIHIITTPIEHSSIYSCCKFLECQMVEVSYAKVNEVGRVDLECLLNLIKEETVLISIMHVNNETGIVQPIEEIGEELKKLGKNIFFHVDGAQGFGKVPLALDYIDLYTLSGHKIGAPKGIGILVVKEHVEVEPIFFGGGQEQSLRPGTLNVPAIVALAEAIQLAKQNIDQRREKLKNFYLMLFKSFSTVPYFVINSAKHPYISSHIFNFSVPGIPSALTLKVLENKGIIASSQSACFSTGNLSRVLMEITGDREISSSSIRLSIHEDMKKSDIDYLIETVLSVKDSFTSRKKVLSLLLNSETVLS